MGQWFEPELHESGEVNPNIGRNFDQIFKAAAWSLSNKMPIPALMLLYSAMDIAAGLGSADPEPKIGKEFKKWVDQYMAPEKGLSCTATDLYGARCGLVHGFSPASNLSRNRKARMVVYAWGTSDPAKLSALSSLAKMDQYVAIHADDLLRATQAAVDAFLREAGKNPTIAKRVNKKAISVFGNMLDPDIDALLEWGRRMLGD